MTRKEWENNIEDEILYWDIYLKTAVCAPDLITSKEDISQEVARRWKLDYEKVAPCMKVDFQERMNPESQLQKLFLNYIDKKAGRNKILDVGAGPLTTVYKKCAVSAVAIHAVDPLAHEYDKLLQKYSINPLIRTEKCDGEQLTSRYAEDTFHITCSTNAIDHSYSPVRCISEMIKVTKKKGYIILMINEREGTERNWCGFHKWDFFISENLFLRKRLYLQGETTPAIGITATMKNKAKQISIKKMGKLITAVFQKV